MTQRLLLVDDDTRLVAMVKDYLGAAGYEVETAESLAAGRHQLAEHSYDAMVLDFTLRLCQLPYTQIAALPMVPLGAFLLMLNGGYLTMFTAAGGQTIGKMVAGTRVVASTPSGRAQRLPFGTALVRAGATIISIVLVGTGFLMALVRSDRRALHDAVADTRVINA